MDSPTELARELLLAHIRTHQIAAAPGKGTGQSFAEYLEQAAPAAIRAAQILAQRPPAGAAGMGRPGA